jgi:hypothetical protein
LYRKLDVFEESEKMMTIPQEYKSVTVADLRAELVLLDVDDDIVNALKGKQALVDYLVDTKNANVNLEEVKEVEEAQVDTDQDEVIPDYNSPEWQDFVMSKFTDSETVENSKGKPEPKVGGLRRVVGLLIGDILESYPQHYTPSLDAGVDGRASCSYIIKVDFGNEVRTFGAVADSCINNTDDFVAGYPLAVAETRAESRALKKILRLEGLAAEETTRDKDPTIFARTAKKEASVNIDNDTPTSITSAQINMITKKCESFKIDVEKFINSGVNKYNKFEDVPYETAQRMIKRLNDYQSNTSTTKHIDVPDGLKLVDIDAKNAN